MKNKLILSLLLILMIGIAYLYNSKNQSYNEPIVESETPIIEEKTGFQAPMTFMGVYIEKLNTESKNAVAEAILGEKEGQPLDKSRIISELKLSSGTSLYEFDSLLPHSKDTTFYVTMNTEDNTLETTRVTQILYSLAEAETERKKLIKIFEQNYHLVFKDERYTYLKNRHGDLMIIHLKPIGDKYELRLDGIFVNKP